MYVSVVVYFVQSIWKIIKMLIHWRCFVVPLKYKLIRIFGTIENN